MLVRCFWPICRRFGESGAETVDAFRVEATQAKAEAVTFPHLCTKAVAEPRALADQYDDLAEHIGTPPRSFCFLVARQGSELRGRMRPVKCSPGRRSCTRGARTSIGPTPSCIVRSRALPLRTTSACPCSSRRSCHLLICSSTSSCNAAAIMRRAPSRASSSNDCMNCGATLSALSVVGLRIAYLLASFAPMS